MSPDQRQRAADVADSASYRDARAENQQPGHRIQDQPQIDIRVLAGRIFFDNLNRLLGMVESPGLADLLEVYLLCMLLGFRGRHGASGRGELKALIDATRAKIRRIRGYSFEWSPSWPLPPEQASAPDKDPWVRRLVIAAVASAVVMLVLFVGLKLSLDSGLARFETTVSQERSSK
jgi:type IV/VI secretion system ImpK/VasF family protein